MLSAKQSWSAVVPLTYTDEVIIDGMALEKRSLIDQVEAALCAEISSGKWPEVLPGLRSLAQELQVSVPTLSAAIDRLVSKGILSSRGDRKRFRIQKMSETASRNSGAVKRVLIITPPGGIQSLSKVTINIVQGINRDMNRQGWLVQYADVDFYDVKTPRKNWESLLIGNQISRIIIVYGREVIGKWALATGIPVCFLGGNAGDLPIPIIGIDSHLVVEDALEKLVRLGHKRFLIPLGQRHPALVAKMRETYSAVLSRHDIKFNQIIQMPTGASHTAETVWRTMERAWEQDETPTAIIFLDWHTCLTGTSYLTSKGLSIPKDVSVVMIANEFSSDWFRPLLAHYSFPESDLVKAMASWMKNKSYNREKLLQYMLRSFNPGKSIAAPKLKS